MFGKQTQWTALGSIVALMLLWGHGCQCDGGQNAAKDTPVLDGEALQKASWAEIEAAARGGEVRWFFWSGNPTINNYVDGYLIPEVKKRYEIDLQRIPVADPALAINRLLAEKKAGKAKEGRADLLWVNGENFRTGKSADLFYGPFASKLPSHAFVDAKDPAISHDFGVPHEGFESPWCKAQFVMIYDAAKVKEPPKSVEALTAFVQANPGKFTYPAPPDFTGSAFLRHVLYETSGGHQTLAGEFHEKRWGEVRGKLFETLSTWKPHLWSKGETYPESSSRLHQLFGQGEVWLSMSYGPETASSKIKEGQFPDTVRTYLFDQGTIANTNFVAIPFNSPNKAASMVVANFLLSPQAQAKKQDPEVWGSTTVLDMKRLRGEDKKRMESTGRGVATLSPEALLEKAVPEIHPGWAERLEKEWIGEIARGSK